MAVLAGKLSARRVDCKALAGECTLNPLEDTRRRKAQTYRKIDFDREKAETLLVDLFGEASGRPLRQIVIWRDTCVPSVKP